VDMRGKAITLISSGPTSLTIIDGEGERGGILCDSGETPATVIVGFTITGGSATWDSSSYCGGGIYCNSSSPTLTDCTTICVFEGNYALGGGGGINCSESNPTLTNCVIEGNYTGKGNHGGGILCFNSSPTITGCTITNNTASFGGGGIACSGLSPTLADTAVCSNTPYQIYGDWTDNGGNTIADECPSDCVGDFDSSGSIDVDDLLYLIAVYQLNSEGDCDGDGDTDVDDLLILISAWGPCP
ncbi:MAG: hypothetical protein MK074_02360, partial [Phycisphaerales bacterium]|nr:hypothetical protein [Phycisphaerales bacterium]